MGWEECEEVWLGWGWRNEAGVDSKDRMMYDENERLMILREEDDGGRMMVVTMDKERVRARSWTQINLWEIGRLSSTKTLYVRELSLYSIRSLIFSHEK